MTPMNIQKELIIQFIMKYVTVFHYEFIQLASSQERFCYESTVSLFGNKYGHLLQTGKIEQGKLASNTPSLIIQNDIVTFKLNEIKFCKVKMPSIEFFSVIQIIFPFSGAIWNQLVVEEHLSGVGGSGWQWGDSPLQLL